MAENIPTPPIITETTQATPGLNPMTTGTRGGLQPMTVTGNGDANVDMDIGNVAQNIPKLPVADETQTAAGAELKPGGPAETTV